jgi:hypothetical protein
MSRRRTLNGSSPSAASFMINCRIAIMVELLARLKRPASSF